MELLIWKNTYVRTYMHVHVQRLSPYIPWIHKLVNWELGGISCNTYF